MSWNILYPNRCVPVFQNKQRQNTIEIISSLVFLGPSKTHEMAKFILQQNSKSKAQIHYKQIKKRASIINQRLTDRPGKNKIYPGLISSGYVYITETKNNSKNLPVHYYFLTLKSYFLLLGFEYSDQELQRFIYNASKNSVFFGYIKKIMNQTSISFIKKHFIIPIQNEIKKGKIILDDIRFYFGIIPDLVSYSFVEKQINLSSKKNQRYLISLSNFSRSQSSPDWKRWILRIFYPNVNDRKFLENYYKTQGGTEEYVLLNRTMTEIRIHVDRILDQ